jgi:hypothetical protein
VGLCLISYSVLLGSPSFFASPLAGNFQPTPGSFESNGKFNGAAKLKGNKFTSYAHSIARSTWSWNRGTTGLPPFDEESVMRSIL